MRTSRAIGALTLLLASGLGMAALPASAGGSTQVGPWRQADHATFTRARAESEPWRDAPLVGLLKRVGKGVRFAPEELAILDAYNAGLPISDLESQVLTSRLLLRKYILGENLPPYQEALLHQYRAYLRSHQEELADRTAALNAMVGRTVARPDGSRLWELYSDPELFNQLDGGKRTLERRFGKKGGLTKVRIPGEEVGTPDLLQRFLPGIAEVPLGPIATPLVNNLAADTTAQDTQSETSLVLGAGSKILASFNDSGSFSGSDSFTGYSKSGDSGTSWTDLGKLPITALGDAGDPVFARSSTTGTVILSTLEFDALNSLPTYRMDDDGVALTAPVDGAAGGGQHDKEWITCDNFAGTGQGNFYMFWRNFGSPAGMTFTRSTDDGLTWGSRQLLASSGQGAFPVVGADHAVYAFWFKGSTPRTLVFRKSVDQGVTFGAETLAATLRTTGTNGDLALAGGFRTNAFPQVMASPIDANQLYMIWNDRDIAPSTDKSNIYFSQTTDGGATWSAPVKLNTDATLNDQWQPVLAITPDGTGLFASWYDRRLDPGNSRFEVFARHATISGSTVTWGNDYRVTDGDSPVVIGQDPVINTTYMGDYDQAVADNSFYYRTWSDNRLASAAHANQPDVRFAKVPKAGPGPILGAGGSALTAESCLPANSAPDPGETVTVDFTVTNMGTSATSSLVGTLQASGGVTSPSGPQAFGAIAPGASETRSFTFVASGSCGGTITPTLQLQDGATNHGTLSYPDTLGGTVATGFANSGTITINDNLAATPYPSQVTVSGILAYDRVTVTLTGMSHTWPDDIDIILVAPGGQKAYVMSDAGSGTDIVNVNLTFDDLAATSLGTGTIVSGTYKPSNVGGNTATDTFPGPAPAGPYSANFSVFNGLGAGANGTWSLYVRDDVGSDFGSIASGWTLTFHSIACATACNETDLALAHAATSGATVLPGGNITYSFTATNNGPVAADNVAIGTATPAGTTFVSATPSAGAVLTAPGVGGTGAVNASWAGSTAVAGTRTLTMVVNVPGATAPGTIITSGGTATMSTVDNTPGNNTPPNVQVTVASPSAPFITSFSPSSGKAGTLVNIVGPGVGSASAVAFNGAAATFTPISATQVRATVPVAATTGPISVTNASGTTATTAKFTVISSAPRITSFTPSTGTTGTVVTINGANLAGTTDVWFNGVAATSFTQVSATQVKATVPAAATTGPISLATPFGVATTGTVKFTKY